MAVVDLVIECQYLGVIMRISHMRPSLVIVYTPEVILLLTMLPIALMMLNLNYSKHIAVVFIVATCCATAPMNLTLITAIITEINVSYLIF